MLLVFSGTHMPDLATSDQTTNQWVLLGSYDGVNHLTHNVDG